MGVCAGLAHPTVHPVFADLAGRARVVSFAKAAHTIAVECPDGKIMLGMMRSLDDITPAALTAALGGPDAYRDALAAADLVALVNWTMIPNMTAIFSDLVDHVLPRVPVSVPSPRHFFFDLADPEKRSSDDLRVALAIIARFEQFGRVTLGLNLKEAHQVASALALQPSSDTTACLRAMTAAIREKLAVATVVVHPRECAACATADGTTWVPGPVADRPLITTGAGDHFNAGFASGQLLGLTPESCLALGVCTSGHYVRTAESPSLADLDTFLANWL